MGSLPNQKECSYCYNTGHNKTTCPVRKKRVEQLRLTDPENWAVYSYDQDQSRLEESRRRAVRNRKCSFCERPGHNRRGCPSLKAVKQACYEANRSFRPVLLEYMTRIGLAPGALMVRSERDYNYDTRQYVWQNKHYIVRGINWELLNFNYAEEFDNRCHIDVMCMATGRNMSMALTSELGYDRLLSQFKETGEVKNGIVISPGPMAPKPPEGWLKSTPSWSNFSHRFKDKEWTIDSFANGYQFANATVTKAWREFTQNDF